MYTCGHMKAPSAIQQVTPTCQPTLALEKSQQHVRARREHHTHVECNHVRCNACVCMCIYTLHYDTDMPVESTSDLCRCVCTWATKHHFKLQN